VEHKSPKVLDPARETDWVNFLLACSICNSIKGNKPTNEEDFVWPDRDNTLLAFQYRNGLLEVDAKVSQATNEKINRLIDLLGLDRHPGHSAGKLPSRRDSRYRDREEVWTLARNQKSKLDEDDSVSRRSDIVDMARGYGFFGVWMSVFDNHPAMRKLLIAAFKGTALDCFDDNCECIPRDGGHI